MQAEETQKHYLYKPLALPMVCVPRAPASGAHAGRSSARVPTRCSVSGAANVSTQAAMLGRQNVGKERLTCAYPRTVPRRLRSLASLKSEARAAAMAYTSDVSHRDAQNESAALSALILWSVRRSAAWRGLPIRREIARPVVVITTWAMLPPAALDTSPGALSRQITRRSRNHPMVRD